MRGRERKGRKKDREMEPERKRAGDVHQYTAYDMITTPTHDLSLYLQASQHISLCKIAFGQLVF